MSQARSSLHTHAVAANLTYAWTEGLWKASTGFRSVRASQLPDRMVYRMPWLAEVRALGYEIDTVTMFVVRRQGI